MLAVMQLDQPGQYNWTHLTGSPSNILERLGDWLIAGRQGRSCGTRCAWRRCTVSRVTRGWADMLTDLGGCCCTSAPPAQHLSHLNDPSISNGGNYLGSHQSSSCSQPIKPPSWRVGAVISSGDHEMSSSGLGNHSDLAELLIFDASTGGVGICTRRHVRYRYNQPG